MNNHGKIRPIFQNSFVSRSKIMLCTEKCFLSGTFGFGPKMSNFHVNMVKIMLHVISSLKYPMTSTVQDNKLYCNFTLQYSNLPA